MLRRGRSMRQNSAVNEFVAPSITEIMLVLDDELVRSPYLLKV